MASCVCTFYEWCTTILTRQKKNNNNNNWWITVLHLWPWTKATRCHIGWSEFTGSPITTFPKVQSEDYRCLAGSMAMHACQIGPTDTAPLARDRHNESALWQGGKSEDYAQYFLQLMWYRGQSSYQMVKLSMELFTSGQQGWILTSNGKRLLRCHISVLVCIHAAVGIEPRTVASTTAPNWHSPYVTILCVTNAPRIRPP